MLEQNLNKYKIAVPNNSWEAFLNNSLQELFNKKGLVFENVKERLIPKEAGVYLITNKENPINEIVFYIGRSKNLSQRIYKNHLMGNLSSARLKKYLVNDDISEDTKLITTPTQAKEYMKANCKVRWILESEMKNRAYLEGYLTGLLKPIYGVYEEH